MQNHCPLTEVHGKRGGVPRPGEHKVNDADNRDDLSITLGIEEEFFLVDPVSRDLLADPDPAIFEACEARIEPHKVTRELLRSQIETNTRVCESVTEAREALRETRRIVIEAAEAHGAAVMAASTHPFAQWRELAVTAMERYERFAMTFQESIRRLVIGGMHVHAGFGDPESRIRVMTAMRRYLPAIHALSTSSPFNGGHDTGYKSYRLNLIGNLPRTSLPGPLYSRAEFDEIISEYRRMKFIETGSEIWWDIRPAHAFPTIELRICDICPRMEDAVAIAALYVCLLRWLMRQDEAGALPPEPLTEVIAENRWVAQRYGTLAFFGDTTYENARVDIDDFMRDLVETLAPDARALGCEAEIRHTLAIIRQGSGADRQADLYRLRRLEGDSDEEALRRVVDLVLAETREGVF
ncbi:MAG: carboxylate-amine ligase [Nitrospinae bacterium]|nr:carboxylate-amine ligase [Nitrospinota bacterium]